MPKKVTQFTREMLDGKDGLSEELVEAIREFAMARGMAVDWKGGTFDRLSWKPRLEFRVLGEDGDAYLPEKEAWKRYAEMYGLPANWLGAKFLHNRDSFEIVGLRTSGRSKYNVACRRPDGRVIFFASMSVKVLMQGVEVPAAKKTS